MDTIRLQDDIDDAIRENVTYRRGLFWIVVFGLFTCAVFVLGVAIGLYTHATAGPDYGGYCGAMIIFGGIGTAVAWCAGGGWWNHYNHVTWIKSRTSFDESENFHHSTSQVDDPARRIVMARRRLRDAQDGVVRDYPKEMTYR